jgi:hypothetical protein
MKKMIIVGVLGLMVCLAHAQTFDEWFKQKETQINYLIQQIAALKAYGDVINKGYDIANSGLSDIFNSKDRDYRQHDRYFISLWRVKPGIKDYSKVSSTYKMKAGIEKQYELIKSFEPEFLNDKEKEYIQAVFSNLINGSRDLTNDLGMILTDNQLGLKDDERLQRIDSIYLEMQDRYQFSRYFISQIKLLVISRLKEKNEVNKLSSLYPIK